MKHFMIGLGKKKKDFSIKILSIQYQFSKAINLFPQTLNNV